MNTITKEKAAQLLGNPQELFNHVARHLVTQGQASVFDPETAAKINCPCAYRGVGGLMCAVGCIIPEDVYHPNMEGGSLDVLVNAGVMGLLDVDTRTIALLNHLQSAHDTSAGKNNFREAVFDKLQRLAEIYSLSKSELVALGQEFDITQEASHTLQSAILEALADHTENGSLTPSSPAIVRDGDGFSYSSANHPHDKMAWDLQEGLGSWTPEPGDDLQTIAENAAKMVWEENNFGE